MAPTVSNNFLGLIWLLSLISASWPHILRKSFVTCRSTIVPSLLTLASLFSARHFATKDVSHAVQDSAFCRSNVCWSFGSLDTIVVVSSTSNKSFIILIIEFKMASMYKISQVFIVRISMKIYRSVLI